MRLHPRYILVRNQENALQRAILEVLYAKRPDAKEDEDAYLLTLGERLQVVQNVLGGFVSDHARYQIRAERHPDDPGKKGDEE